MAEQEVGKVIHYYDKAMVAVVRLSGNLKAGDTIKVAKGENEFEMKIASMQVNHEPVESGKAGDEVAIKVDQPTKEGAVVSLVTAE
jgi:translation elongation factor EF-1alpha